MHEIIQRFTKPVANPRQTVDLNVFISLKYTRMRCVVKGNQAENTPSADPDIAPRRVRPGKRENLVMGWKLECKIYHKIIIILGFSDADSIVKIL